MINETTETYEWIMYVNGQLGLHYQSELDALRDSEVWDAEGFDCTIVKSLITTTPPTTEGDPEHG